jgi:flavin-dependent dehydrogenase
MMSSYDYDVVIIGAGPGGSTCGTFLAKAGHQVLILEKEHFPRFHVGESLLPCGNDVLKASGAWDFVEKAGFMPKFGAEFCAGNGSKSRSIWFSKGLIPGYGQTFQVERSKFDHLLLKHAQNCGCVSREGAKVESVAFDEDGVDIAYKMNDASHQVRSRWIVDASGRDTFLGKYLGLPKDSLNIPKRIATFAHFKKTFRHEGDEAGHITVVRMKGGWFWLIPLDAEKTSVGMVQELEPLKQSGITPENSFQEAIRNSSELQSRMEHAEQVSDFYTTSNYCYNYRVLAGPRMLMVGDSGGFIDPIFSSGVMVAVKSGQIAAELISGVSKSGASFSQRQQRKFTKEVQNLRDAFSKMILNYYYEHGFEVFIHPQSRFKVVEAVNSLLAGHTKMKFNHWWRIQFFFLICSFQKWFAVAPRLDLSTNAKRDSLTRA